MWHVTPEFVIELRSDSDRLRTLREKMQEWIANGVRLGWLINPKDRTVEIYRPGVEPEVLVDPTDVNAIAKAMVASQRPALRASLIAAGHTVAAAHGWDRSASVHLQHYYKLLSAQGPRHARNAVQHSLA